MEEWKPIIIERNGVLLDFTGLYEVSSLGRIKSLSYGKTKKAKIMKPRSDKKGYQFVTLMWNGQRKTIYVHRLVANAFIPNNDKLPQVNHKNEIKHDNRVENLEWCTARYNVNYGTANERRSRKGKDSPNAKSVICLETHQRFDSVKEADTWLGKGRVSPCLIGKAKTAGGYHWQYLDDYRREQRMNTDINNSRLAA